jgi:hypothetical protein
MALPPPLSCAKATWLQNTKARTLKKEKTVFSDFISASIRFVLKTAQIYAL